MAEIVLRSLIDALLLFLAGVGVLMLIRTLRGQRSLRDRDWRFLFGKPKDEVLTTAYWLKVGVASVICLVVGFFEYYFVAPFGFQWFVAAIVMTALGIAVFAPRLLR